MTAVTVIIPAYNAERFIVRSVRSVLAQTHSDWELIIIADDRQDYKALLEAQGITDARLRFTSTGKIAAGPAVARNAGLDMATYDIIANLDADDAWDKDFLKYILPAVAEHGACTGTMHFIDEDKGTENANVKYPEHDGPLLLRDILRHSFSYQDIVFDRKRSRARWPEALRYGEDTIFWAMLLDDLPGIYYVSAAHYYYYMRQNSLSRLHPKEDTSELVERLERIIRLLDSDPLPVRNADNRNFLKRWFDIGCELEEFFNYKIVAPEVYTAELNRRYDQLFG